MLPLLLLLLLLLYKNTTRHGIPEVPRRRSNAAVSHPTLIATDKTSLPRSILPCACSKS